MNKDEFLRVINEIKETCRKRRSCFECPFCDEDENEDCMFGNSPMFWKTDIYKGVESE